jgi:hypothetical protein
MTDSETERLKASSFARAHLKLQLAVDGPLHDVEIYLGDDQKSALVFAPDGRGHWAQRRPSCIVAPTGAEARIGARGQTHRVHRLAFEHFDKVRGIERIFSRKLRQLKRRRPSLGLQIDSTPAEQASEKAFDKFTASAKGATDQAVAPL